MPDIATVSDSREVDACHVGIRSSEGGIKIVPLGDDSQHSAAGCSEAPVRLALGARVEQLMAVVGLMGGLDVIALAGRVGIAPCCCNDASAASP